MVVKGLASELRISLGFWLQSGGLKSTLDLLLNRGRTGPAAQEKQEERERRVVRIELFPNKITLQTGEPYFLSAIAYNSNDVPVGGVDFKWQIDGRSNDSKVAISANGEFRADVEGTYHVTVEGAGRTAHSVIKVKGTARQEGAPENNRMRKISSQDFPLVSSTAAEQSRREIKSSHHSRAARIAPDAFGKRATPAPGALSLAAIQSGMYGDPYGWNNSNAGWAYSPANERGNTPGRSIIGGATSGNFNLTAPIVSLPGRGLDLDLSLVYRSRIWSRTDTNITLDIDQDPVALGWSFGLSKVVNMIDSGAIIIESDGTRHSFTGWLTTDMSDGSKIFTAETTDGSFIKYVCQTKGLGTPEVSTVAKVYYPNGTIIAYSGKQDPNAQANVYNLYPVSIFDSNGNLILITYENFRIKTMKDTLGRVVTFHYETNGLLTAITAAGVKDDDGNTTVRTLVRLTYKTLALDYGFNGLTPVVRTPPPVSVPVLNAIYYPGMGTGYWFGDTDSYSSYGMIRKVSEQRGMTFSNAPLNEQGIISTGSVTKETVYNYPLTRDDSLADAPAYTTVTESWDSSDTGAVVTSYNFQKDATTRTTTVTLPDQTKAVQYAYHHPGQLDDGLVYREERLDSNNVVLQTGTAVWEPGYTGVFRLQRTSRTDERNQTTTAVYDYGTNQYNQVYELSQYGFNNELLRKVRRTYQNIISAATINWPRPLILGLVTSEEVLSSDDSRVSCVEYEYDHYNVGPYDPNAPFTSDMVRTVGVTQHNSGTYDPYFWGYYSTTMSVWTRGNLTGIVTYTDAPNHAGPIASKFFYDITGNVVKIVSPGERQRNFSYTLDTQFAYPTTLRVGETDPNSTAGLTLGKTYDFNTGLELTSTDAMSRTTTGKYSTDTWRPVRVTTATGASTTFTFDDTALTFTQTTYDAAGSVAAKNKSTMNGLGQVILEEALADSNSWDVVKTRYDIFGRVWQKSRPYRSGTSANQIKWGENFYDALGRLTKVVMPDGSMTKTDYNEAARPAGASVEPGQTIKSTDAWGRQRWGRMDADGRLVEMIEPKPDGNGSVSADGLLTTYQYDTLGNLTLVTQGDQRRLFKYDSLGRLTHQKLAERSATLDDNGIRITSGTATWSDVFSYDERSNLVSRTDSLGVKTIISYLNADNLPDPLNRLQSISYDTQGNPNVLAAPKISFTYMTGGDTARPRSITTEGVSTEEFKYEDAEGRRTERKLTFLNRPAYPMVTRYSYDSLNRLTDIYYPQQYGSGTATPKEFHQDFDTASRLRGVKVNGTDYASQITYNASSRTTSLKVGPGGTNQITENYGYDPLTGLLASQKVVRGAETPENTLLNLEYGYLRPNTTSGVTGQLTQILNNRDHNRDRSYSYDALGRLAQASGGPPAAPIWTQTYTYDRYGNRRNVSAVGHTASLDAPEGLQMNGPTQELALNLNPALPEALRESLGENPSPSLSDSPLTLWGPGGSASEGAAASRAKDSATLKPEPQSGPINLSVANVSASQVNLSWTAAPGAVDRYELQRSQNISGPYTPLSTTTATTYQDNSVSGGVAYLYRVRAIYTGGGSSAYSNVPVATTVVFADNQLSAGASLIRAQHLTDLRQAINALRTAGGLAAFPWTNASPAGTAIRAVDIQELRSGLDQALTALGSPTSPYTDPSLPGVSVRAVHIDQLRQRLRGASATNGPATPPSSPTALAAAALSNSQISLSWTDNSADEDGFKIERKTGANGMYAQVATVGVNATGYTDSAGLSASTLYYYRVRAVNPSGDSGYSNEASATSSASPVPSDGFASLSFDAATNHITTAGFQYDEAGNLTRAQRPDGLWQRFQYDAAGRLVKVKDDNNQTVESYTYGYSRRRLMTQYGNEASSLRTYYVWGAEGVLAEYVENETTPSTPIWAKNYFYLGSNLLATQEAGPGVETLQFHHQDRLGARIISNPATATSFEQTTLPFGVALDGESTGAISRRFTSYERSSGTGLDYASSRFYDSSQGRFTQVDSIGMDAASLSNPQSLNLYAYCGNDPINCLDPSGTDETTVTYRPPGFPPTGPGGGWLSGSLGGIFSFGFGLLGALLGWGGTSPMTGHILGLPFITYPPTVGSSGTPQTAAPPMVTVAVYGKYTAEYEALHSGNESFVNRARDMTNGNVNFQGTFDYGIDMLSEAERLSARVGAINSLNFIGHATARGMVAHDQFNHGVYIANPGNAAWNGSATDFLSYFEEQNGKWTNRVYGATTVEYLAEKILSGSINIAENGEITFWGCSTDAMASHLQWMLKEKRPDIKVTGAVGEVRVDKPVLARPDHGWNTWTGRDHTRSWARTRRYKQP